MFWDYFVLYIIPPRLTFTRGANRAMPARENEVWPSTSPGHRTTGSRAVPVGLFMGLSFAIFFVFFLFCHRFTIWCTDDHAWAGVAVLPSPKKKKKERRAAAAGQRQRRSTSLLRQIGSGICCCKIEETYRRRVLVFIAALAAREVVGENVLG